LFESVLGDCLLVLLFDSFVTDFRNLVMLLAFLVVGLGVRVALVLVEIGSKLVEVVLVRVGFKQSITLQNRWDLVDTKGGVGTVLNSFLLVLVVNDHKNVLIAQDRQLHGFLDNALFPFAARNFAFGFVFDHFHAGVPFLNHRCYYYI
jgi:hypothetical protein